MDNILPRRELIWDEESMEGVYGTSLVLDPAIQILALSFNKVEDVDLSADDISDDLMQNIISKGEKEDLSEWVLIDEKRVTDESVYNIDLAVIPTEGASALDNKIFKIRYEYFPKETTAKSRKFCVEMTKSGLTYKKEDLVKSDANAGFGPNGTNTYNIFLYKGGVNCQHYWNRKIYLQKNNKEVSVYEATKVIQKLDKESAKVAKFPYNESTEVANESNNYYRLSSELKDIRLANAEKRILVSPVLLPEQDIYRNFDGEKCNVFLTADTIERLQQNFFKKGYQKNSTIEHTEVIDGVYFFESWIVTNPKNDKANELGFDVPVGTWMMSMKVDNESIWNDYVKTGKVKGFSIDARLGIAKEKKNNSKEKMNYSKVKDLVMKQILLDSNLQEFKIDDALSIFAESLDKDNVVFDKDNNPMPNAEFQVDGKIVKTGENGEIVSVEDAPKAEEAEVEAADETPVAEAPKADAPADNKLQEDLDAANKRIEELEVENQSLKAELISIKEEAVKLSAQANTQSINLANVSVETKEVRTSLQVLEDALNRQNSKK